MHPFLQPIRVAATVVAAAATVACGNHDHDQNEGGAHDEGDHGHVHVAPHDGVLVELGDHFANVEVTFDADTGQLTVYGLGGHAEQPERAPEESLKITVKPDGGDAVELSLAPNVSSLSGEKVGDSSMFQAQSDALKGWGHFHGSIEAITLRGTKFEAVEFAWPPGHSHGDEE